MSIRRFGDAAKAAERRAERDASDYLEYQVLDQKVKFFNPGTAALVHISMMQTAVDSDGNNIQRGMAAVVPFIQFVTSLVEDRDAAYIRRLLSTENSGFDIMDMMELFDALLEDWATGTPTTPASGSSPTRATTGKRSTATSRRAGSTRSTSASTGS